MPDPKPTPPSTVSTPATAKPAPMPAPTPPPAPALKSLIDLMDEKRDEIERRQAFLDKAKAELDALIQKHNLNK